MEHDVWPVCADAPSPFKPHVNGLILIAVGLLLFVKAMVSLFRTTVSVSSCTYLHLAC